MAAVVDGWNAIGSIRAARSGKMMGCESGGAANVVFAPCPGETW